MDKLLGYTEWVWDESDLPEDSSEWDYEDYANSQIEILAELSATLSSPGSMDNHWEYGIAVGYVGWMNSFGQTEVKEVDSIFLKYMVFDTINDSNIIAKLDFSKVESGVITLRRSHHDRPMGETIYLFRCEEDQEMLDEESVLAKLKELGLDEEE
tara:strand:- start:210 stop:674 length:465 start_codon:yes stop_codon:yes gene_type:complete